MKRKNHSYDLIRGGENTCRIDAHILEECAYTNYLSILFWRREHCVSIFLHFCLLLCDRQTDGQNFCRKDTHK